MIVVKVELHSAITGKASLIGSAIIHNVWTSENGKRGNYKVAIANKRDAGCHISTIKRPQRTGEVKDYPRLSYSIWRLVFRALKSAFPEEQAKGKAS